MAIGASVLLSLQVVQNPESIGKKVRYTSHNHFKALCNLIISGNNAVLFRLNIP